MFTGLRCKLKHSTQQDAVNINRFFIYFTGLHCKMNHSIQQDLWKCWSMCTGLHCKLDLTKCCKHKKWFLVQNLQDYTAVVDDGAHPTFLQQVEGRSLSERAPRTPVMPTTEGNVGVHMLSTCRQASWRTHSRSLTACPHSLSPHPAKL